MTNIVICGANGKMGHTVAACIAQRTDCKVIGGIDVYTRAYGDFPIVEQPNLLPEKPDVFIDYSNPASLAMLLEYCLVNNVALVLTTTGYSEEQIAQIKGGKPEYITEGKIPDSHICFLDEIFKSGGAILNTLLQALNERRYTNEGVSKNIPVISFFSASVPCVPFVSTMDALTTCPRMGSGALVTAHSSTYGSSMITDSISNGPMR